MTKYPTKSDTERRIHEYEDERLVLWGITDSAKNRLDYIDLELINLRMQLGQFPERVT